MQWCMPTTGIVLFAAGKKSVSNARATVDYAVEDEIANWRENFAVGGPGLIFWAAGVPPSKDITWTTAREPTCPKPTRCHAHPSFEMDVALAVLTTGPVGLGDGPGMTNASLAARTCRADGTLLKPSKPQKSQAARQCLKTLVLNHLEPQRLCLRQTTLGGEQIRLRDPS